MTKSENTVARDTAFKPGFRLSVLDVLVLIAGAVGSWLLGAETWWAGALVAFVVGHFFLFCNVFRIARMPELIWAGAFVLLSSATILGGFPGWPVTFGTSLLLTCVLIAREMRKPSYHGIAWQRVNPDLRKWWDSAMSGNKTPH